MNEREIDLMVIELGYIEGLIAFHEWHNRKYKKYTKKDGLTLKEIEKIRKVKHGVYEVIKVDQKKLQEGWIYLEHGAAVGVAARLSLGILDGFDPRMFRK